MAAAAQAARTGTLGSPFATARSPAAGKVIVPVVVRLTRPLRTMNRNFQGPAGRSSPSSTAT